MSVADSLDFQYVRELVRDRSAIVLETGKEYLVESRLSALARREGLKSVRELVARLRSEPFGRLHRQVVEAMTTNETSFFRDIHPFDALRTDMIPALMSKRAADRSLTIWCAASSSGQEPYSIAMTLREHFPDLGNWTVRILCTDINRQMLERTKAGVYSALEVNRGLPGAMLVRHFHKVGTEWHVRDELKKWIECRELNLAGDWPVMPMADIIFIRNVLIYFDVATKRRILGKCRKLLRPEGYLLLGSAETTINIDDGFDRVQVGKAACYRVRAAS